MYIFIYIRIRPLKVYMTLRFTLAASIKEAPPDTVY